MYYFKTTLSKTEKQQLLINENKKLDIRKVDYFVFDNRFETIIMVQKINDKNYFFIQYKDDQTLNDIFRFFFWNFNDDLFGSFKINDPMIEFLTRNYSFCAVGREKDNVIIKRYKKLIRRK